MTKKAFMDELLRGLAPLNSRQRQEIQSDFDEHFAEGCSMGLSEAEICRQLGQPAQIAEQFLEEARLTADDIPPRNAEPAQADRTDKQAHDHDFDIDRAFASSVRAVKIDLRSSRLTIKSNGPSEKIVVQVSGITEPDRFYVESCNDELVIRDGDNGGWLDMLFMRRSRVETTVWLPERFQGDVDVYVKNGETSIIGVSGHRLKAKNSLQKVIMARCRFGHIDINVSAGNLHVADCVANDMKLRSAAGSVRAEHTQTKQTMEISSAAGQIHVNDCTSGNTYVRSAAGNVSVDALTINDLNASSAAGNVAVKADRLTGDIRLDASAGAVRLETRDLHGNIDARSAAGSVTLLLPSDVNARFETHSSMGSVTQKIAGNAQSPFTVRASSSMGSVLIKAVY